MSSRISSPFASITRISRPALTSLIKRPFVLSGAGDGQYETLPSYRTGVGRHPGCVQIALMARFVQGMAEQRARQAPADKEGQQGK